MSEVTALEHDSTITELRVPDLIVAPDWLGQHLDHPALRLLDARPFESYQQGHIPGAVQVDLAGLTHELDSVPGMLLPPDAFARQMSRLGVANHNAVVIYDDNWGLLASRVLWSLARYGHRNVALLNGGSDRWREEGRPWTLEPFTPSPVQFVAQPDEAQLAERSWLLRQIDRADLALVDTRAPGEYLRGHLPDAIAWDWTNGLPWGTWDVMRPPEELRAELAELGITPDKEIVTYCHSGVRAAHTYLLLRSLGYQRVRVYDGSWLEWSRYAHGRKG